METPVALFVFNRPDVTAQVFASIAAQKPETLLLIADGPRADRPGEVELCAKTLQIVRAVDWKCRVLTNVSANNLGCSLRVSSGLDWVFSNVEKAIILEDDCLPSPDFFRFCEEMLERYKDDPRIGLVSGDYFLGDAYQSKASYFFSRFAFIWGWAAWRRSWRHYDWAMTQFPDCEREGVLDELFEPAAAEYWKAIFREMHRNPHHTWDYQLSFAFMTAGLLNIVPSVNLVSNIGFSREDATHTRGESPLADLPVGRLPQPLTHPGFVVQARRADRLHERHVFHIQNGL